MITLTKPNNFDLFKVYCKVNNRWGVYMIITLLQKKYKNIEFSLPLWNKYWKSKMEVILDAMSGNHIIFLCDTEEEMNEVYAQVRGDDGLSNDRTPGDCYVCTCSPEGILLTENT